MNEKVECPRCQGAGNYFCQLCIYIDCPVCDGKGVCSRKKTKKEKKNGTDAASVTKRNGGKSNDELFSGHHRG